MDLKRWIYSPDLARWLSAGRELDLDERMDCILSAPHRTLEKNWTACESCAGRRKESGNCRIEAVPIRFAGTPGKPPGVPGEKQLWNVWIKESRWGKRWMRFFIWRADFVISTKRIFSAAVEKRNAWSGGSLRFPGRQWILSGSRSERRQTDMRQRQTVFSESCVNFTEEASGIWNWNGTSS